MYKKLVLSIDCVVNILSTMFCLRYVTSAYIRGQLYNRLIQCMTMTDVGNIHLTFLVLFLDFLYTLPLNGICLLDYKLVIFYLFFCLLKTTVHSIVTCDCTLVSIVNITYNHNCNQFGKRKSDVDPSLHYIMIYII